MYLSAKAAPELGGDSCWGLPSEGAGSQWQLLHPDTRAWFHREPEHVSSPQKLPWAIETRKRKMWQGSPKASTMQDRQNCSGDAELHCHQALTSKHWWYGNSLRSYLIYLHPTMLLGKTNVLALCSIVLCWHNLSFPLLDGFSLPSHHPLSLSSHCFRFNLLPKRLFQELHKMGRHKLSQASTDIPSVAKWCNTQEKRLQVFTTVKGRFVFSRNVSFVLAGVSDTFCIMINPHTFFMQIVTQQLLSVASSSKCM